jgi:hypothetical protein
MRYIAMLLVALVLVAGTALISREIWLEPGLHHIPIRQAMIAHHLEQTDGPVIVGDSLVERNAIRELCGRPVLNAGIAGARTTDLLAIAQLAKGRDAILAVGVNDYFAGHSLEQFKRDYLALVEMLQPKAVVGITGPDREPYNAVIRSVDAVYIEPLPDSLLYDGVHYSPVGAKVWVSRLEEVCTLLR